MDGEEKKDASKEDLDQEGGEHIKNPSTKMISLYN